MFVKEEKSGKGLAENSKLPKSAQAVRVWRGRRQERGAGGGGAEGGVKEETANEACFNTADR